jgi:hypothetical protein
MYESVQSYTYMVVIRSYLDFQVSLNILNRLHMVGLTASIEVARCTIAEQRIGRSDELKLDVIVHLCLRKFLRLK